ncbi:MAG: C40 family peptidase [Deltaproteobacteria bacterium]|jgi:cell wall-associated NlpC family hydrolase|nr:C40 family peptidase [Deltaproteobacteria bacterium]
MKNLLCCALLVFLLSITASCGKTVIGNHGGTNTNQYAVSKKVSGDAICRTLRTQIGTPYKYGGNSPSTGFDCSGLVRWAYQQYGIKTPRTAQEQAGYGRSVPKSKLYPGDVVVFRVRGRYHTGVYVGNNNFIHSPRTGANVQVESLNSGYWKKTFSGARRII